MEADKYLVTYNGQPVHRVSPALALQQRLSDEGLETIKALHCDRLEQYERFQVAVAKSVSPEEMNVLIDEFTAREFKMQEVWGFSQDVNFHRFWDIPGCLCPRMDNDERVGTPYKVYNGSCPIHGMP